MRVSSLFFICLFVLAQSVFAGSYLVVVGKAGKPLPDLAKSFKAAGKGKMEFVLDTNKTLDKTDVKLNYAIVKASLEKALGKSYGVKVTGDEKSTIVEYTGEANNFLKAVAKTKMKVSATEEVAMDGSASDSGVRAKDKPDREPTLEEVRATVIKIEADYMIVNIDAKGADGKLSQIKNGKIKVSPVQKGFEPKKRIYFVPKSIEDGTIKMLSVKSE